MFQYSDALRTSQVDQIQNTIAGSGSLRIFAGVEPVNCAAPDPAGLLATIILPITFLNSASGVASMVGTWSGVATGTGIAASFRMYDGSGICHVQGDATTDLILNNTSIVASQTISISSFKVAAGNG
jgi:hypothetical protein